MHAKGRILVAVVCGLILGLGASAYAVQAITASEARNHVGEMATVCGQVAGAHYAARSRGEPTFINLDRPYPDQIFTIVVWGSDRAKFGRPETEYEGKDICVTGRIKEYRGVPEIAASNPIQIRIKPNQAK